MRSDDGSQFVSRQTAAAALSRRSTCFAIQSLDRTLIHELGQFGSGTTKFEQSAMVQKAASNQVAHFLRAFRVVNPLNDQRTDCRPVARILFQVIRVSMASRCVKRFSRVGNRDFFRPNKKQTRVSIDH
jgi:hypothetical protein